MQAHRHATRWLVLLLTVALASAGLLAWSAPAAWSQISQPTPGAPSRIPSGTLLGNMSGATGAVRAIDPAALVSTNFNFAAQTPGGALSVGSNTVTLTPCPAGVNGTNTGHYLYVSGGTGTAEVVLLTGGTCTSGAASGTVIFTAAQTHSGAWTVTSATAGILEALRAAGVGGHVHVPPGTFTIRAKLLIPFASTLSCAGQYSTTLAITGITSRALEVINPAGGNYFNLRDCAFIYGTTGTSEEAIYLQEVIFGSVDNVLVINAYAGIALYSSSRITLKGNTFSVVNNCFSFSSNSGSALTTVVGANVTNTWCEVTNTTGPELYFAPTTAGINITDFFGQGGAYGVLVADTGGAINEVGITNAIFDSYYVTGFLMQFAGATTAARWRVTNSLFAGLGTPQYGVVITTGTAGNIVAFTLDGNTISVNHGTARGITLQGTTGTKLLGNTVNNAQAHGYALLLTGAVNTNVTIAGNILGVGVTYADTTPFDVGVYIDAQAHTGIKITGNHLSGSVAPIANNGTGGAGAITGWDVALRGTGIFPLAGATSGKYIKSDGTNWIAATGSAAGIGACTNQVVTAENADAAPTCTTLTSAYTDTSLPARTTGTFTITGTGFTAGVTGTAKWEKNGTMVSLFVPTLSGTSNATTFTLTGLPAAITPSTDAFFAVSVKDNTVLATGYANLTASSTTITLYPSAALGSWTNSGTKQLTTTVLSYNLQ